MAVASSSELCHKNNFQLCVKLIFKKGNVLGVTRIGGETGASIGKVCAVVDFNHP